MRAGFSSRPAITSERSAASATGMRSMMRYCIGFESGTGGLGDEPLHQALRCGVAPVTHAEHGIADVSLGVDHERHGKPAHLPCTRDVLLRVEDHWQRNHLALEELRHF